MLKLGISRDNYEVVRLLNWTAIAHYKTSVTRVRKENCCLLPCLMRSGTNTYNTNKKTDI